MRFRDLKPIVAEDPIASTKYGSKVYSLLFTCPICGPPHRMALHMHEGEAQPGLWKIENAWPRTDWKNGQWDWVSLYPSVVNDFHGFKPCGLHVVIRNGEL